MKDYGLTCPQALPGDVDPEALPPPSPKSSEAEPLDMGFQALSLGTSSKSSLQTNFYCPAEAEQE